MALSSSGTLEEGPSFPRPRGGDGVPEGTQPGQCHSGARVEVWSRVGLTPELLPHCPRRPDSGVSLVLNKRGPLIGISVLVSMFEDPIEKEDPFLPSPLSVHPLPHLSKGKCVGAPPSSYESPPTTSGHNPSSSAWHQVPRTPSPPTLPYMAIPTLGLPKPTALH